MLLEISAGAGGLGTRLEILDGQRMQLPDLRLAAIEAAAAAMTATAAISQFRTEIQEALQAASLPPPLSKTTTPRFEFPKALSPHTLENWQSPRNHQATVGQTPVKKQTVAYSPEEVCKVLREQISSEVRLALANAEAVVQQVRRIALEARRCIFVGGCRAPED